MRRCVLATVFSYRPRSTAIVAAVGMAGIAFVALGDADVGDATTREILVRDEVGRPTVARRTRWAAQHLSACDDDLT